MYISGSGYGYVMQLYILLESSFPSRIFSIGIKVMSKFGPSQELSPEYIYHTKWL